MPRRFAAFSSFCFLVAVFSPGSHSCPIGYHGSPCTIRRCESLIAPSNGVIVGQCLTEYSSVCRMQCYVGYEAVGSEERRCDVSPDNVMIWTGSPLQCTAIRCPFLVVVNAHPPSGVCTSQYLEYNARCTFTCRAGYRLKGSKERVCQLDKSWSGSPTICEQKSCPKLQIVQPGVIVTPSFCATGPVPVFLSCHVTCPPGYTFEGNLPSHHLVCQLNEQWSESIPTCQDIEPPALSCPGPIIETSTDKGKPTANVIWSIQVTDNSVQVDPNAVIRVRSSNQSGQEHPIGTNVVKVTATDEAGNMDSCSFNIVVRDLEPPSCSFCPGDIVREELERQVRVNWERPICSDNSGFWPTVHVNRLSGDIFDVPGSYHIQYTLIDIANNVDNNCSFRITLKVKTCPMFTPPLNGALVCNSIDYNSVCAVFCKTGTDFVHNPPLLYYCSSREWLIWPYGDLPPWPDCSGSASPSWIKRQGLHWYYYSGDAHDPNVQEVIKSQFHGLLTSHNVPPFFCPHPTCNKDDFTVSPGVTG